MLSNKEIIDLLNRTGHLSRPFNQARHDGFWPTSDTDKMNLQTQEVKEAIQSYQTMFATDIEPFVAELHPERKSLTVYPDGEIGPATMKLLATPRCGQADYVVEEARAAEAKGSGNWYGCHGVGDFHKCHVRKPSADSIPTHIRPIFDDAWALTVAAYAEYGLLFQFTEGSDWNTTMEFVNPNGGWLGLAIVGSGNYGCKSQMWAKFDRNWRPTLNGLAILFMHEYGHNTGMSHSNGGILNPYLKTNLPPSFKNDPHESFLKREFGGVRVPTGTPPVSDTYHKLMIARKYNDGRYEDVMEIPRVTSFFPT